MARRASLVTDRARARRAAARSIERAIARAAGPQRELELDPKPVSPPAPAWIRHEACPVCGRRGYHLARCPRDSSSGGAA